MYRLHSYKLYRDLHFLYSDPLFNNASMVHPVKTAEDFYVLHSYFSKVILNYDKNNEILLFLANI